MRCHWKVRPVPAVVTLSVTLAPAFAVELGGAVVMVPATTLTDRVAVSEVTRPPAFDTSAEYAPASSAVTAERVSEAELACSTGRPFFSHWYCSGAVPAAATVNVALPPAVTRSDVGCVLIVGAVIGTAGGVVVVLPVEVELPVTVVLPVVAVVFVVIVVALGAA